MKGAVSYGNKIKNAYWNLKYWNLEKGFFTT